jgi:ethanolamine utilization protein EutJ
MQANYSSAIPGWLAERLDMAAELVNDPLPLPVEGSLRLGIDLGTSDVVSIVLDAERRPVAVCLEWADVVRDGVVFDFCGAVSIVRRQLALLESKLGRPFTQASTSFPPGTDPRISINVLEAAGLTVTAVIDEPSAVARLLELDRAAVVDIGGGTTGIAILQGGEVVYSGDEATGGRHVSLALAGSRRISLEAAEAIKLADGGAVWPTVRPVFQKMADIVRSHLAGHEVDAIYLSGGSCALPGVGELFASEFPEHRIAVPRHPIFFTPLAIAAAACGKDRCAEC